MLFEEFTDPLLPERREKDSDVGYSDPELARTLDRVSAHYPYYKRGVEGFMKYATRAIKHSDESDHEQAVAIEQLRQEIDQVKAELAKLKQRR